MAQIEIILLATDGSSASETASEQAIDLATQLAARLLVVSVLGAASRPSEASAGATGGAGGAVADSRDTLTNRAQAIVQRAKAAGADATFLVWEGDAGEAIVAAANSENADLIVVGSHGRSGVSRFFIGSVSDYVVRHAHCPVMVVRGRLEATRH
jgi:nucleotide-binding universal stress UspA family protein